MCAVINHNIRNTCFIFYWSSDLCVNMDSGPLKVSWEGMCFHHIPSMLDWIGIWAEWVLWAIHEWYLWFGGTHHLAGEGVPLFEVALPVCNNIEFGGTCRSKIHMKGRFPAEMALLRDDHYYSLHLAVVLMSWPVYSACVPCCFWTPWHDGWTSTRHHSYQTPQLACISTNTSTDQMGHYPQWGNFGQTPLRPGDQETFWLKCSEVLVSRSVYESACFRIK